MVRWAAPKGSSDGWFRLTVRDQSLGAVDLSRRAERGSEPSRRFAWPRIEIDAIERGEKVTPNERDGLNYLRIVDAAVRSSQTEECIAIGKEGSA